jgi:DNA primase
MQTGVLQRLSDDEIQRAKARLDLITTDVALKRKGRELQGLCPFHNEKSPSFYLVPEKGFFHCFGCGAHGDAIGFVMRQQNLDFVEAVHAINGTSPQPARQHSPESVRPDADSAREDSAEIADILRGCTPINDPSPHSLYLWARGLRPNQPGLLAHPALECWELGPIDSRRRMQPGNVKTLPAIVAPFQDSRGEVTAILRIYLDPAVKLEPGVQDNRAKLKVRKKGLGRMRDGAIRLTPLERVEQALGLCEGVETAGAVRAWWSYPTWACGGTARFGFPRHWRRRQNPPGERVRIWIPPDRPPADEDVVEVAARAPTIWIPDHVERVLVYGDNGETGRAVAEHAAAHWRRTGLDADAVFPDPQFSDFNDQWYAEATTR